MSKLRQKLAGIGDFNITGYSAYKGVSIMFKAQTNDEELKKKIAENNLSTSERNFIISTISEYFEDTVKTDDSLFNYAVGNIVIDYMEGNMNLPSGLINQGFIDSKCMQKKQGSDQKIFQKNKFRALPLNERIRVINDYSEFLSYVWLDDYINPSYDIKNLIAVEGLENEDFDLEEDDDKQTASTNIIKRRIEAITTFDAAVNSFKAEYNNVFNALEIFVKNCERNYVPKLNENPSEDFDFIVIKAKEALNALTEMHDQFSEDFFN